MRKQGLSRRERNMVEEAVTQVCWAMGVNPRDGELRQTAWAEILSVYREDPAGFRGSGMRGWRLACDLAGEAVWKEEQYRQRRKYGGALAGPAGERGHGDHPAAAAPLPGGEL